MSTPFTNGPTPSSGWGQPQVPQGGFGAPTGGFGGSTGGIGSEVQHGTRSPEADVPAEKPRLDKKGNPKKPRKSFPTKKVVSTVAVIAGLGVLVGGGNWVNTNFINVPEQVLDYSVAGTGALQDFQLRVNMGLIASEDGMYDEDTRWLQEEARFVKNYPSGEDFVNLIMSTVSYEIPQTKSLTTQGEVFLENGSPVMVNSLLNDGETVNLTYVDYENLPLDKSTLGVYAAAHGFDPKSLTMDTDLTNLFADYVVSLGDNLPVKTVERVPEFIPAETVNAKGEVVASKAVAAEEGIFLDQELFSSPELWESYDTFAKTLLGGLKQTPEWQVWNTLSKADKEAAPEPQKYDPDRSVIREWTGAYYWTNVWPGLADGGVITPPVGTGSDTEPAGLGTPILTYQLRTVEGELVKDPILVTLDTVLEGQDAIYFLEGKDTRNRGLDVNSKVQLISFTFSVRNLGTEEITIYDNSVLSDARANASNSTGEMYGLTTSVTLKPGEIGTLEGWASNSGISNMFLVWGKDFDRREPVVWFNILRATECAPVECVTIDNPDITAVEPTEEPSEEVYILPSEEATP